MRVLGVLFLLMVLYYMVKEEPKTNEIIPYTATEKPDPGRVVHHYDWKQERYIYTDEIKPEPTRAEPMDYSYYPDVTVQIVEPTMVITQPRPRYIRKDGKYYRIIYKPNGTEEIKLIHE